MATRTLLLTPWFIPMKVIPWEAAIKLKYEQLVDVVVEYAEEVSSPSVTWRVPAVVRLRKLAKRHVQQPKYSRLAVYVRDRWCCQYCGKQCTYREATRDHVTPRAHGGLTNFTNTVLACQACNTAKGSKTCDEWGVWPLTAPYVPRSLASAPIVVRGDVPDEWLAFVRDVR